MKIGLILKIILGALICVLAVDAHAANKKPKSNSSCSALFLLSELESNAEFKAKLALIKKSGWKIEFDAKMERDGFVDGTDESNGDLEFAAAIEADIKALKESNQSIPTKLLSEHARMLNWKKTIVVSPTSPAVKEEIVGLVESAHYFETVDFVGFKRFLLANVSSNMPQIISARRLENAYLAMLRKKIVYKTIQAGSMTEEEVKKTLAHFGDHFGLPDEVIQKLWVIEIPEKFRD